MDKKSVSEVTDILTNYSTVFNLCFWIRYGFKDGWRQVEARGRCCQVKSLTNSPAELRHWSFHTEGEGHKQKTQEKKQQLIKIKHKHEHKYSFAPAPNSPSSLQFTPWCCHGLQVPTPDELQLIAPPTRRLVYSDFPPPGFGTQQEPTELQHVIPTYIVLLLTSWWCVWQLIVCNIHNATQFAVHQTHNCSTLLSCAHNVSWLCNIQQNYLLKTI